MVDEAIDAQRLDWAVLTRKTRKVQFSSPTISLRACLNGYCVSLQSCDSHDNLPRISTALVHCLMGLSPSRRLFQPPRLCRLMLQWPQSIRSKGRAGEGFVEPIEFSTQNTLLGQSDPKKCKPLRRPNRISAAIARHALEVRL